ncbi:MAG: ATP-dependent 6-phosphofructokinase [Anaerohalosphaera sp.]|nr:ATP-dependent 6-phosphofructokinase [Anaerohalosphaera sp.]
MAATKKIRSIAVLTGGGDCPGLNAVIRAVTKTAINRYGLEVWGIQDGYLGLIEKRLAKLRYDDVSNILTVGGTILGSSNKSNPSAFPVKHGKGTRLADVTDSCVETLKDNGIDALVCIGGDGTMASAATFVKKGIPVMGVPKTIDNDVYGTDVTFGFDTAVTTATEAIDKLHTTASSHHRIMVVEVMGRYAGWIALHAGIASGSDVILIPEIPYSLDKICQAVEKRSKKGRRYSIIIAAEGAKPSGGKMTVARTVKDSPDPIRLGGIAEMLVDQIHTTTGLEAREVVLGHIQRGGTPSPYDRVLATGFGNKAIELLMAGTPNHLVVWKDGKLSSVLITKIAGKIKTVKKNSDLVKAAKAVGTSFGA